MILSCIVADVLVDGGRARGLCIEDQFCCSQPVIHNRAISAQVLRRINGAQIGIVKCFVCS